MKIPCLSLRSLTILLLLAHPASSAPLAASDPDFYRDGSEAPFTLTVAGQHKPPIIDGELEWSGSSFLLGQSRQTGRRFNWGGTQDVSASIRLGWDAGALYLGAEVQDDKLSQATSGAEIWQGDTLELFFNAFPGQQRIDGFAQQALVPAFSPDNKLRVTGPPRDFTEVEGVTRPVPGGYILECRIPWSNLPKFSPGRGARLGFQIYVDDRDGTGRKTQLLWYPSAISFAQPRHTNELILGDVSTSTAPSVLAGPNTWVVTDPARMGVSAVAHGLTGAGAHSVTIEPVGLGAAGATFPLSAGAGSLLVGQATMDVGSLQGLTRFQVLLKDASGTLVAESQFQAQLLGAEFREMRATNETLKQRVASLAPVGPPTFPQAEQLRAGLSSWQTRLNAFVFNEARPESINGELLHQMRREQVALQAALDTYSAGGDPYLQATGSLVRAYRSPLTGEYRPYALLVPPPTEPVPAAGRPLIVLLHSIFADERMLSQLASTFEGLGAIVYQAASYRQFDWGGVSAAEAWAGLEDVETRYKIDPNRRYLVGYHIGGRGTWQLAVARPDYWAAAAPLLSGIDTAPNYPALRLYPHYYNEVSLPIIPNAKRKPRPAPMQENLERKMFLQASLVTPLENLGKLPVQASFGEDDPDAGAERLAMERLLRRQKATFTTRYWPGAMHGSPAEEFRDPGFFRNLLAHRRPALPETVSYTTALLRNNGAWWVAVEQLASPDGIATVRGTRKPGALEVRTQGAASVSVLIDKQLGQVGQVLHLKVDGQRQADVPIAAAATRFPFIKRDGRWQPGAVSDSEKRHGISGPIDDFQHDRFLFVYGTGGDEATRAAAKKRGEKLADWGLGARFLVKADVAVTEADVQGCHLILVGTPGENSVLTRISPQLPLKWLGNGFQLGATRLIGPGAGACFIYPNPLQKNKYVVVLTATDEAGFRIWEERKVGGDFVLGQTAAGEGRPVFKVMQRGWFNNRWEYEPRFAFAPTA